MNAMNSRFRQQGLTTVEFSLVGTVLFLVLFGLIEFGRLVFTWNVLDEVTRRAARLAAVCPIDATGQAFVRDRGAFGGDLLPNFTEANIALSYWQQDGTTTATTTEDTYYVRASIINYEHAFLVPLIGALVDHNDDSEDGETILAPDFSTTLPAESLGVHPSAAEEDGAKPLCSL